MSAQVLITSGTSYIMPANYNDGAYPNGSIYDTNGRVIVYGGGAGGAGNNGYGGAGSNNLAITLWTLTGNPPGKLPGVINVTAGVAVPIIIGSPGTAGTNTNNFIPSSITTSQFDGMTLSNLTNGTFSTGGGGGAPSAANGGGGGGSGGYAASTHANGVSGASAAAGGAGGASGDVGALNPFNYLLVGGNGGSGGLSGGVGANGLNYGGGGGGGGLGANGGYGGPGAISLNYDVITAPTITNVNTHSSSPLSTLMTYCANASNLTINGTSFATVSNVQINGFDVTWLVVNDNVMTINNLPIFPQNQTSGNLSITNQVATTNIFQAFLLSANLPDFVPGLSPNTAYQDGTSKVEIAGSYFTQVYNLQVNGANVGANASNPMGAPIPFSSMVAGQPNQWTIYNDNFIFMYPPPVPPQNTFNVQLYMTNFSPPSYGGNATFSYMTYIPTPLTLTGISQPSGDESGGYTVNVFGTSFTTATKVLFGTAIAPSFTVLSDELINVTVPPFNGVSANMASDGGTNMASDGGTVNITVQNETSSNSSTFDFTYTFSGYPALNMNHGFV